MLPQLVLGLPILLVAIVLGLGLSGLIRIIYNKIFSKPDFPDAFSHALLRTVTFVPGWIIILFGAYTALNIINFRLFPSGMFLNYLWLIFTGGLVLYLVNAWRKARV